MRGSFNVPPFVVCRTFVLFAIILLGRDAVAVDEFDVPEKGSAAIVLAHVYPESITARHTPKFSIDSRINGIRRSREFALQLSGPGERQAYGFNHTIDILSRGWIEARVYTGTRTVRERFRNVFYDPSHRTVVLVANQESLPKLIASDKGTIVYLFAGPFPKRMSKAQRVRALRNYRQTNYILFRFL